MIKYYFKSKDFRTGESDLKRYCEIFDNTSLSRCILFLKDENAVYISKTPEYTLVLLVSKRNVGLFKIYEKSIVEKCMKRAKMSKIEEAYKIAKEIECMSIDEFIEKMRGDR
ncbi:hypothetical protein [Archaeoglobus sp.]